MPAKVEKKARWLSQGLGVVLGVAVALLIVEFFQQPLVQDSWRGAWYEPAEKVREIEEDLELTGTGKRIFAATRPQLEDKDAFNEHCESIGREVSLLGCYTEGRIYVYEVTRGNLTDSNKVTMAHELLHAAWGRTNVKEKERLSAALREVQEQNAEWFAEELKAYADESKIEEVWARAGTKLRDLPEELEEGYRKYFTNRLKIVEFYESYQAPFLELQERNKALKEEILTMKTKISLKRDQYLSEMAELDEKIEEFNRCADKAGCFTTKQFQEERDKLTAEKERLEKVRKGLNEEIEKNNAKVVEYQENQLALGELTEAMNSRVDNI